MELAGMSERSAESRQALLMAKRVVEHHFGGAPRRVQRQHGGLTNHVYSVHHGEGDFIVRLAPEPEKFDVFRKELFATAKARKAGVPVPAVLHVGNDIVPYPYMVQELVRGEPGTHHPKRLDILREMGRYGRLINSITTAGFGHTFDWLPEAPQTRATWLDFLNDELKLEDRLAALARHELLDDRALARLRDILLGAGQDSHAVLNHGDLRLKNVLVDEQGEIVAVLDWEDCVSSLAPHWEWSVALHDLAVDEKEAFLHGYGATPEQVEAFAPVIKALNVINYLPAVEQAASAQDPAQLAWIRARLRGALDLYAP
jgi:aminoglycoside phosphotransferase (APT) family kinase protein